MSAVAESVEERFHVVQLVHQVRYRDGELYWDVSGRVRRSLTESDPAWEFAPGPDDGFWKGTLPFGETTGEILRGQKQQLCFGARQADILIEFPPDSNFGRVPFEALARDGSGILESVLSALAVRRVTRIGTRLWVLRSERREGEAIQFVAEKFLRAGNPLDGFGRERASTVVRLIDHEEMALRVEIASGSVTYRKPHETTVRGLLINIDAAVEVETARGTDSASSEVSRRAPSLLDHMMNAIGRMRAVLGLITGQG